MVVSPLPPRIAPKAVKRTSVSRSPSASAVTVVELLLALSEPFPQWRTPDRMAQGVTDSGGFVCEGRRVPLEENVSAVGESQGEAVAAVVHFEVHDRGIILQLGERKWEVESSHQAMLTPDTAQAVVKG